MPSECGRCFCTPTALHTLTPPVSAKDGPWRVPDAALPAALCSHRRACSIALRSVRRPPEVHSPQPSGNWATASRGGAPCPVYRSSYLSAFQLVRRQCYPIWRGACCPPSLSPPSSPLARHMANACCTGAVVPSLNSSETDRHDTARFWI